MAKLVSQIPKVANRQSRRFRELVERAADSHVAIAQQLAPRDTGAMADTTHKEPVGANSFRVVAPQPYSGHVEFGTIDQEAQPWFRPAFASAIRQMKAEAKEVINK